MSIISTLPNINPIELDIAWWEQIREDEEEKFNIRWKNPLNYLQPMANLLSTIRTNAVLNTLNKHIVQWQTEKSPDITHFQIVLESNPEHLHIILMVLIHSMEKNEVNLKFIRQNLPTDMTLVARFCNGFDIKKLKKYSNLQKLTISSEYLDCMFSEPKQMIGLLIDYDASIFARYKRHVKTLSLSKPRAQLYIHHIFTNLKIYKTLLNDSKRDHEICAHYVNYLLNIGQCPNLSTIMDKFKIIFKTKQEQLIGFIGISMLIEKNAKNNTSTNNLYINVFNTFFKNTYPEEFKLFKTMQSLGITNIYTITENVINNAVITNSLSVNGLSTELPLL